MCGLTNLLQSADHVFSHSIIQLSLQATLFIYLTYNIYIYLITGISLLKNIYIYYIHLNIYNHKTDIKIKK